MRLRPAGRAQFRIICRNVSSGDRSIGQSADVDDSASDAVRALLMVKPPSHMRATILRGERNNQPLTAAMDTHPV